MTQALRRQRETLEQQLSNTFIGNEDRSLSYFTAVLRLLNFADNLLAEIEQRDQHVIVYSFDIESIEGVFREKGIDLPVTREVVETLADRVSDSGHLDEVVNDILSIVIDEVYPEDYYFFDDATE